MICKKVDLYEHFGKCRADANGGYLNVYVHASSEEIKPRLRPAILILPGGGYCFLSYRESEPVAIDFYARGYNAFVLEYSVNTPYPAPLEEGCMAVKYIRDQARNFDTDEKHVAAIGFSAGGHLAGLLATLKRGETQFADCKINAAVLSYPVVTMGEYTHEGSRKEITGGNTALFDKLSVEKRVDKNSAPVFIWHTAKDDCVLVQNSLMLAGAYAATGADFTLHVFEKGWHGLSLCNDEVSNLTEEETAVHKGAGIWTELAREWLKERGFCVKVRN